MSKTEFAGPIVTVTVGESPPYTMTCDEAARLRAVLLKVRPTGHDHLCDSGPDGEDAWVDRTEEDAFMPHVPYVGWCCHSANQRHAIDEALGIGRSP